MSEIQFLNPYEMQKVLSGVIAALPTERPEFMQGFFPEVAPTEHTTVNFDKEFRTKNVMGTFASPESDMTPVQLPNFGTQELIFSYSKEGINSDSFADLNQRQLGDQFGMVDVIRNKALRLARKTAEVEQRFRNLFELCSSNVAIYGGYSAKSQQHPEVRYNFNRTVITSAAYIKPSLYNTASITSGLQPGRVPSVNLTTTDVTAPWDASQVILPVIPTDGGNYTAGEKSWTKANIDAGTATPFMDLTVQVQTVQERTMADSVILSEDAYEMLNYDIEKNYKDAASTVVQALLTIQRDITPRTQNIQGVTYKRMITFGEGTALPVYIYRGMYTDRNDGSYKRYIPLGWSLVMPTSGSGIKIHGRILHPRANYAAMPRWMNYWMNDKTGLEEWEYHTNFIIGHTMIDAVCAWKVC